ncbi:MAG: TIGR00282 family metallophosphoesterase [Oscillospiraceae bacterium]|nr:TIGR00282 family metallophosphoesterase [Oscillospiraceae bacterium]
MKILFIGDVVGSGGCEYVRNRLPSLKKEHDIAVTIANGENSAIGNGILPQSARHLFDSGVDIITTGNHVFKRKEIYPYLDETQGIIRPANISAKCPGRGLFVLDCGRDKVCVINLIGQVYMEPVDNPFCKMDRLLQKNENKITIVDFHAEATSEKGAMAHYLDGRVSAVIGTHTHVQTCDEQILPRGTGFITDAGMTGPQLSVLGVTPESIISKLTTGMPAKFETSENPCFLNGVILDIDSSSGKCVGIKRVMDN